MANVFRFPAGNKAAKQRAIRDAAQREVQVIALPDSIGSDHSTWEVIRGHFVCGQVVKFHDTATEKHPFKATGRPYLASPIKQIGTFYLATCGGFNNALAACVKRIAEL
jgi:hypothetical protein